MKSQTRAWVVFALLFCLWSTLPASPFHYFADMIAQWFGLVANPSFLPAVWQTLLTYLLVCLLLAGLLLLGRSRSRLYLAGICALAEMVHHLILCIRTNQIYAVSPAIAIGLALALFFLIIKAKSPALWLSDAFILSLSVWLIFDGVLPPLLNQLDLEKSKLAVYLQLPAEPLINHLDGLWRLPALVWAVLPLAMAIVPIIFLSRNRQKG